MIETHHENWLLTPRVVSVLQSRFPSAKLGQSCDRWGLEVFKAHQAKLGSDGILSCHPPVKVTHGKREHPSPVFTVFSVFLDLLSFDWWFKHFVGEAAGSFTVIQLAAPDWFS